MRAWSLAGMDPMTRPRVDMVSSAWMVEITRWPISEALSTWSMVSGSRISPTKMTSMFSRRAERTPSAKDFTCMPTSRWIKRAR